MKRKYLAIVTTVLVLFMVFIQPGYIDADTHAVIDSGTRERLTEQYGLDQPVISNWSGGDVGVSNPDHLFVTVCEVLVNPFVFMIRNFMHYLID
jgi:ABC-type dipeptide/oligopeptide/nickel transport system permease component